jgi:FG-GAP repeat
MPPGSLRACRSRRTRAREALASVLALGSCACSWSRFDDVTRDSPIVLLDKPGSMTQGFGESLATAKQGSTVEVLVGGEEGVSGAALFDLGDQESPGTTAIDTGYCSGGAEPCYLASSLAGFATAEGPDRTRPLCFAVGAGVSAGKGLIVRCQDSSEYSLPLPDAAEKALDSALDDAKPDDFPLANDRTDAPALLAASPTARVAWFYPSASMAFSQLATPNQLPLDDDTFGKTLAVLSVGEGRVYAVGISGLNEVLLWKSDGTSAQKYLGCLGGTPGFGRALASGKVNRDDNADLVVSDDSNVHVIDGRALFELPETASPECGFASLPAGALLASFGCGSNESLGGCAGSDFGAALAVADLDGDGQGEVIVGAPGMTVRDTSQAGAVLVYNAHVSADPALIEAKFLSSAEPGDHLGAALTTPSIEGRDIIVAGAPGNGKTAVFYCSPLLHPGAAGARCP